MSRIPVTLVMWKIKNVSEKKPVDKVNKYCVYPNNKQKELLAKTFGYCRFVYNK